MFIFDYYPKASGVLEAKDLPQACYLPYTFCGAEQDFARLGYHKAIQVGS